MQESELINEKAEGKDKGGHSPSSPRGKSNSKLLVSSSKKRWGNRPVINLHSSPVLTLKWFTSAKGSSERKILCAKSAAQKMKFSTKDFFSNCDQFRRKLLVKKTSFFVLWMNWNIPTFASLCIGIIKNFDFHGRETFKSFCLRFSLGPAPRIFTLLKIPIPILRPIQITITLSGQHVADESEALI